MALAGRDSLRPEMALSESCNGSAAPSQRPHPELLFWPKCRWFEPAQNLHSGIRARSPLRPPALRPRSGSLAWGWSRCIFAVRAIPHLAEIEDVPGQLPSSTTPGHTFSNNSLFRRCAPPSRNLGALVQASSPRQPTLVERAGTSSKKKSCWKKLAGRFLEEGKSGPGTSSICGRCWGIARTAENTSRPSQRATASGRSQEDPEAPRLIPLLCRILTGSNHRTFGQKRSLWMVAATLRGC